MQQTLHADLMHTSLDDFGEHLERILHQNPETLLGEVPSQRLWGNARPRTEKDVFEGFRVEGGKLSDEPRPYVRIVPQQQGHTARSWWLLQSEDGEVQVVFGLIQAVRLQTDRLRIIVREPEQTISKCMRKWLNDWWLPGQWIPHDDKTAPQLEAREPMPELPARATDDDWFALFDWYRKQKWTPDENRDQVQHLADMTGKTKKRVGDMLRLYHYGI